MRGESDYEAEEYGEAVQALAGAVQALAGGCGSGLRFPWAVRVRLAEILITGGCGAGWGGGGGAGAEVEITGGGGGGGGWVGRGGGGARGGGWGGGGGGGGWGWGVWVQGSAGTAPRAAEASLARVLADQGKGELTECIQGLRRYLTQTPVPSRSYLALACSSPSRHPSPPTPSLLN